MWEDCEYLQHTHPPNFDDILSALSDTFGLLVAPFSGTGSKASGCYETLLCFRAFLLLVLPGQTLEAKPLPFPGRNREFSIIHLPFSDQHLFGARLSQNAMA